MSDFEDAVALEPDGNGGLTGALDRDWWSGVGPHGGYMAALAARAALTRAGRHQELRSLTVHYLEPAWEGEIAVECEVLRATRGATTVRVTMRQRGDCVLTAVAALLKGRRCPELEEALMPAVPAADDTPVSSFLVERGVSDIAPAFAHHLEYRHCLGPDPLSGGDEAISGGWLQFADRSAIDPARAAMLTDAWWPAVWSRMRQVPRTPTVDLTIHFRQPLPGTSEPLLAVFRSRLGTGGFLDEDGELWSADGRLLVQSRQLAVLVAPTDAL